jgi:branched-chain amino acid transport system substrate-binding protein
MMRIAIAAAVIGCLALPVRAGDAETPAPDGTIRIGATFPRTGPFEMYGQSAYFGARERVREINTQGGVNGKRLEILWRDNRGNPAEAVRNVEELAGTEGVQAIIGPLLSEAAMAVREAARERRVVILLPAAAMDAITHDNPWMFRSTFNNSLQADAMSRFQRERFGAETAAVLFDARHGYAVELAELFAVAFTARGGRVTGTASFAGEDGDIARGLRELAEARPDFIYAPCYATEAIEVVRAARATGVNIRFVAPDAWDSEFVFSAAGRRLIGTHVASSLFELDFSYSAFDRFFQAMVRAGMDNPDALAASAYDAVSLLAVALRNGETADEIRQGLLAIENLPLATGITTITPDGSAIKPIIIRQVEPRRGRLVAAYAGRVDPE